jgi:aerobic carbon-monoxide dehydrogenase medium subunit
MYTAEFHYLRPRTLSEAEEMFHTSPDGRYIAGGQSLIPAMKQRLANPADLIDISRLPGLAFIRREAGTLVIGAATRHADVAASAEVKNSVPALALLAGVIGDPAVRHRGTLGGSLSNNDPAADYPAAVLALDATVQTNRRKITADKFFTGIFATALEPGEIVTQVAFRLPRRAAYTKHPNPASRYAMPGIFVSDFGQEIRVAVTGAASCVYRASAMESALAHRFAPESIAGAGMDSSDFSSDLFASAEYRGHLVKVMAQRAVASML